MNRQEMLKQFEALRHAGVRGRDAAEELQVTEGEIVAACAQYPIADMQAQVLQGPWITLLQGLEACGPVLALTRNESVVHEKTGVYKHLSAEGDVGLALGKQIDLRLFFKHWHAGFLVRENVKFGDELKTLVSMQFYDASGIAVHKVYVRDKTDQQAFDMLAQKFAAPQGTVIEFQSPQSAQEIKADEEIDVQQLLASWAALKDVHEFFGMLKELSVERKQSFRLVEGRFTHRLPALAVRSLLQKAAQTELSIMVFVGSKGCIQIHTGPVHKIMPYPKESGPWINVMDPEFNLHLREDHIDQVWIVQKPTSDGVVTSVEVFNHCGELAAMFFGARKPGKPEQTAWRELVEELRAQAGESVDMTASA